MKVPATSRVWIRSVWWLGLLAAILGACASTACEERCDLAYTCGYASDSCVSECDSDLEALEQYSGQCRGAVEAAMACTNNRLLNCVAVFEDIDCNGERRSAVEICGEAGRERALDAVRRGL